MAGATAFPTDLPVNSTSRPHSTDRAPAPSDSGQRPCACCGYPLPPIYEAAGPPSCARCGHSPGTVATVQGKPIRPSSPIAVGALALPAGFGLLLRTPGWVLLLALPALGTFALLAVACSALWNWAAGRWGAWRESPPDIGDGAWADPLERLLAAALDSSWTGGIAGILGAALLLIFGWFAFALCFEALLGPFLDELHTRVERRRYGREEVERLGRPQALSTREVTRRSSLAGLVAMALVVAGWAWSSPFLALTLAPLPFVLAAALSADYGRWFLWVLAVEGRALGVGLAIAAGALSLVVLLLPVTVIPVVGLLLYALGVGFGTSLSLLDLPCARRGWSVGLRWRFARRHALPLSIFGALCGAVFAIPVLGVLLGVPSASLGAFWLIEQLEKPDALS